MNERRPKLTPFNRKHDDLRDAPKRVCDLVDTLEQEDMRTDPAEIMRRSTS